MVSAPFELPSYHGMFLCTVAKWRPPFEEKRSSAPVYEGRKLAQTLHKNLGAVILPAPKITQYEQEGPDNEEQYALLFGMKNQHDVNLKET